MDDREMTLSLAADLRALLPVVRHHITMLSTPATARQDPTAEDELARLTGAMAELCAQAEAEDCAVLLYALHDRFAAAPGALQPRFAAVVLDALTLVQERVEAMGAMVTPRTPTAMQRAQAERQARLVAETPNTGADGAERMGGSSGRWERPSAIRDEANQATDLADPANTADAVHARAAAFERSEPGDATAGLVTHEPEPSAAAPGADPGDTLTEDELALLQSFQASVLRRPQRDPFAVSEAGAPALGPEAEAHPLAPREGGSPFGTSNPAVSGAWRVPTAEELDFIPPEMQQLFLVETAEDTQDLRLALLRYEQRPDDPAGLTAMGRIAHKIKGAAATLGFNTLAGVLHSMEDVIKALKSRRIAAGPEAGAALVRELALVQAALDAASSGAPEPAALVDEARLIYAALISPETGLPAPLADQRTPPSLAGFGRGSGGAPGSGLAPDSTEAASTAASGGEGESYLRVDVRRLDELMRHISALAVNRAALTQTREDVTRLQSEMDQAFKQLAALCAQLTDLQPILHVSPERGVRDAGESRRAEEASGSRFRFFGRGDTGHAALSPDGSGPRWDALELERFTEFDHALRKLTEVAADVDTTSRQMRSLLQRLSQLSEEQSALATRMQRDVMHVRLVPLSSIVPRLELEVRRLGPLTGTRVAFTVSGEMTEIDRNISDALAGPLLQLVRNAVVHGIEPREEREELGKTATGQIWMHAYYVGSEVVIEIGDDGRGINPHRLAASAVASGVLSAEAARDLNPVEALELMFQPGVTTFEAAQAVGGRGIGLDDVRTAIQEMKGSISVRSEQGQGTVFRIRVPISLSIVHALRVSAADQEYVVPFSAVQRTLAISASELLVSVPPASTGDSGQPAGHPVRRIRIERTADAPPVGNLPEPERYEEIPVFALAELLGVEHVMQDPQMALLVEVGRRRVVLLVDGVHDDQEVVVQALPPHLRRRALRGASVTPSGQMLLLLDLPELVAGVLDGTQARPTLRPRVVPSTVLAPRVLVVDDSVSIRRTLEHTLRRGGFDVQVARDGIEALEQMLVSAPRVLVLDIEMPRLDGFELLAIVRESPQFTGMRVVMLSSRAADKHKEHARTLGAEAYLVKPCPQETLVETVRSLLAASPAPVPSVGDA